MPAVRRERHLLTAERTIWVHLPHATFGIVTCDGKVTDTAPIARWAIGRDEREVAGFYRRRGAAFREVPEVNGALINQAYAG